MTKLRDIVQTIEQVRARYRAAATRADTLMKHLKKLYLLECKARFGFEEGSIVTRRRKIYRVAEIHSYYGGRSCFYLLCNQRLKSGRYSRRTEFFAFVPPQKNQRKK